MYVHLSFVAVNICARSSLRLSATSGLANGLAPRIAQLEIVIVVIDGSFATLAAIRRASSRVSTLAFQVNSLGKETTRTRVTGSAVAGIVAA
jgi:hypothetical protein